MPAKFLAILTNQAKKNAQFYPATFEKGRQYWLSRFGLSRKSSEQDAVPRPAVSRELTHRFLPRVNCRILLPASPVLSSCDRSVKMPCDHESSDVPALHFDRIKPLHVSAHFSKLSKSEAKNHHRNQAEEQTEEDVLSAEATLDDDNAGVGGIVPARNGFTGNPFVKFRFSKDLKAYVDRRSGDKAR